MFLLNDSSSLRRTSSVDCGELNCIVIEMPPVKSMS